MRAEGTTPCAAFEMRSVTTQEELLRVRDPGFCYLCGRSWRPEDRGKGKLNRDHVPPRKIFAKEHRSPPLILRTHAECNEDQSSYDEQIAQLLSLVWKGQPTPKDVSKLNVAMHDVEGMAPFGSVEYLNLGVIISRWIRGFHTALYGEYLPQVVGKIHEPLPGGDEIGQDSTLLGLARPILTREIKANRTAHNLDTILAYNGQCRYECVWTPQVEGPPICAFALLIPAWEALADPNYPPRSCVGWYRAPAGIPSSACRATRLVFPTPSRRPFDAFEE